jgi:Ca-activated chloride channel family protein
MLLELMRSPRKVLLFAVMSAAGALVGALVGELWMLLTWRPPTVKSRPMAVCLVLDCSGSMSEHTPEVQGTKLDAMKDAATAFVGRHQAGEDEMAVVGFDHRVFEVAPRSKKHDTLQSAIQSLSGGGGTDMGAALRAAASQLQGTSSPANILLFTDGVPTTSKSRLPPAQDTLQAAEECRTRNVKIIAIATGDADVGYLGQVTGDPSLVYFANAKDFEQAFKKAEEKIFGVDLAGSGPIAEGLSYAVFRSGTWTALLAIGIALALIAGQNLYLRRPLLDRRQAIVGSLGGLAVGLAAGALGQVIFSGVTSAPGPVVVIGRLISWAVLGALAGAGLAFFVPNLRLGRGLAGGVVGGLAGAIGFLVVVLVLGDTGGRLLGAAIVGFCIGIMIALAEALFREAWLEIEYGPRETRTVSLGREPITIGGNPEVCTVLARGAPAMALRYTLREGRITCEDVPAARTTDVLPGDRRTVGNLAVVVRAAGAPAARVSQAERVPKVQQADRPQPVSDQAKPATPQSTGAPILCLYIRGRRLPLTVGTKFTASDIAGLETTSTDGTVAEVVPHPSDAHSCGLKNLSTHPWPATVSSGEHREIEPGRSIRLTVGTEIRFGALKGKVE